MNPWLDTVLVLLILTNLYLLGSSRLNACIRTVAAQAVLLGIIPLLAHGASWAFGCCCWRPSGTSIKAGVLPWLLRRAVREAGVRTEVEPIVGFTTSLLLGLGSWGRPCTWPAGCRCPAPRAPPFLVPVALFTTMVGMLVIVGRRKAIMQALGYLAMENGIYAFGLAFAVEEPLLVEMGVLLDVSSPCSSWESPSITSAASSITSTPTGFRP